MTNQPPPLILGASSKVTSKAVSDHLSAHVEPGEWVRASGYYTSNKGNPVRDFISPNSDVLWGVHEVLNAQGDKTLVLACPKDEPLLLPMPTVQFSAGVKLNKIERMDNETIMISLGGASYTDCGCIQKLLYATGVDFDLIVRNMEQEAWNYLENKSDDLLVIVIDKSPEKIYHSIFSQIPSSPKDDVAWIADFKGNPKKTEQAKKAAKMC